MGAVARAVDPPDRAAGPRARELMEHAQHRREAHARTDECDRAARAAEHEVASGRTRVEDGPDLDAVVQVSRHQTHSLALHADAIEVGIRHIRERVGAAYRGALGRNHKLDR